MIKRTLKFTLCALALGAGISAFANGPITLKDKKTTVSWEEFAGVINGTASAGGVSETLTTSLNNAKIAYFGQDAEGNIGTFTNPIAGGARQDSIAAYNEYNTANKNLSLWQGQIAGLSSDKVTPTWLSTAYKNAQNFEKAYDAYDPDQAESFTDTNVMYYAYKTNSKNKTQKDLYVSFGDSAPTDVTGITGLSDWETATAKDYYDDIVNDDSFIVAAVYVYYGSEFANAPANTAKTAYQKVTYTSTSSKYDLLTLVSESVTALYNNTKYEYDPNATTRKDLQEKINGLTTVSPDYNNKTKLEYLADLYEEAKAKAESDLSTLKTAEKDYNDAAAAAEDNYDEISITGSITATTPITKAFTGTINGNNNVITVALPEGSTATSLFGNNFTNGHLENAIVNGQFSNGRGAYHNVAIWRGTSGTYYDEDGSNSAYGTCKTIGELGFKTRGLEFVSANILAGKLIQWDKTYQTYSLKVYPAGAQPVAFYSNVDSSKTSAVEAFTNVPVSNLSPNTFVWSETNDFGNVSNVVVGSEGSYTCANVVLTDRKEFYAPFQITATTMTYERELSTKVNSICLPFKLSVEAFNLPENTAICTFDRETYNSEKKNYSFVFKKGLEIEANKPALIVFPAAPSTPIQLTASNAIINQTTDQIVTDEGSANGGSLSYGLFKSATSSQLSATNPNQIYVLSNNEFKYLTSETTAIPSFRSVIWTGTGTTTGAGATPRSIRIVNTNGIDVTGDYFGETSAVETIEEVANTLSVVGGQGAIEITSDSNYGKVQIFNLNGAIVDVVEVMEGTTSVNVEKGIYIVMGKKVMVK